MFPRTSCTPAVAKQAQVTPKEMFDNPLAYFALWDADYIEYRDGDPEPYITTGLEWECKYPGCTFAFESRTREHGSVAAADHWGTHYVPNG